MRLAGPGMGCGPAADPEDVDVRRRAGWLPDDPDDVESWLAVVDLTWHNPVVVQTERDLRCVGGCPLGSLSSELAEHDPDARAALADSFSRWSGAIRDGLQRMIDRGVTAERPAT